MKWKFKTKDFETVCETPKEVMDLVLVALGCNNPSEATDSQVSKATSVGLWCAIIASPGDSFPYGGNIFEVIAL